MAEYEPEDQNDMNDLAEAVYMAREELQPFRKNRTNAVRQYVGANYSEDGSSSPVPVNLIEMLVNVLMSSLAGKRPQALVTTSRNGLKPSAKRFELALNRRLEDMGINRTLQDAVRDGLFSVGIVKVGVARKGQVDIDGDIVEAGAEFAEAVDLDDFVVDTSARKWREIDFCGDKYRVPYDEVMKSKLYTDEFKKELQADDRRTNINETGDVRASAIGVGSAGSDIALRKYITFWDIWLPKKRQVVTLHCSTEPGGQMVGKVARTVKWKGPECGPYHVLGFNWAPGFIMPLSPVSLGMDLHDLANHLFNKCGDQASRQKSIFMYDGTDLPKAERVIKARDGQAVLEGRKGSVEEIRFGGVDGPTWGMYQQSKQEFNQFMGNLDLLAGLGPQAPTATQDQLLNQNANRRVEFMQARVIEFTEQVIRSIGWHIWNDPASDLELPYTVPGTSRELLLDFNSDTKIGDIYDYEIKIVPYSMQYMSPQARFQTLLQMFQLYMQAMPMFQAQGVMPDMNKLNARLSRLSGIEDELSDIFINMDEEQRSMMAEQTVRQAPNTSRTNVRVNKSEATNRGQADQLARMMFSGGGQRGAA